MNNHTLELGLRVAAGGQLFIAGLGSALPRILHWEKAIADMPLLVRQVFQIHTWFISLTCAIFAVITWRFAGLMASGQDELAKWIAGAIALFWGVRSIMQWTHYSQEHWRGKLGLTFLHWLLFLGYAAWAVVYALAALRG